MSLKTLHGKNETTSTTGAVSGKKLSKTPIADLLNPGNG